MDEKKYSIIIRYLNKIIEENTDFGKSVQDVAEKIRKQIQAWNEKMKEKKKQQERIKAQQEKETARKQEQKQKQQ